MSSRRALVGRGRALAGVLIDDLVALALVLQIHLRARQPQHTPLSTCACVRTPIGARGAAASAELHSAPSAPSGGSRQRAAARGGEAVGKPRCEREAVRHPGGAASESALAAAAAAAAAAAGDHW